MKNIIRLICGNIVPSLCLILVLQVVSVRSQPSSAKIRISGSKITHSYYIDNITGRDDQDGSNPLRAWKTLSRVNRENFAPGSRILFKRGQSWTGQLHPMGSGTATLPNRIGSYGEGAKPVINGAGVKDGTLYFYNQSYWEIGNLVITNYNTAEENGITLAEWEKVNRDKYAEKVLPAQLNNHLTPKYGIYIAAKDTGEVAHVYLENIEIHGVNGYINQALEESKNNGGIYFQIMGEVKPTYFNGIRIDSCFIHDVDRTGILMSNSTWYKRTLSSNTNWTPSLNISISNSRFQYTGANALIVRIADKPVIEHNIFDHCAIKGSGNAAFSFNCDSALWQYNECRYTKANVDDRDAGGIDADYNTKNTIIQYNYVHDNDYGLLITGGPGTFNDHTILRYNIIENDGKYAHPSHGKGVIRVSGSATNTQIYNNVIYLGPDQSDTKIISHEVWKTAPSDTFYQNNIIYDRGANSAYDLGVSTGNLFDTNLYFGSTTIPDDKNAICSNPLFILPGGGKAGDYKLQKKSPARNSGKVIAGSVNRDFFGNAVSVKVNPNLGVDGLVTVKKGH